MSGTIKAFSPRVHADANCLVIYQGLPNRAISWSLSGSGTLEPFSDYTDGAGRAGALYTPGEEGDIVTVGVIAGA